MCYFVLFWVSCWRKMATILAVSRLNFPSVGPRQFQESSGFLQLAVLVKFAIVEKKNSSIFSTLEEPHQPRVPLMMRTLWIKRIKHHPPKWKVIYFSWPPTIYDKTSWLSHYIQEERVTWRLPMNLEDIKSENIEVYISFNNSIQGNGKSWAN